MRELCKHGYPEKFARTGSRCAIEQPDGAMVEDLHELDRLKISGRGTVIVVEALGNKKAIVNRTIRIDGVPYLVMAFESCLIPGHDEGHCTCFKGTGLLVKEDNA